MTPQQLVARAAANGVKALAITDHDTLHCWDEAIAAARQQALREATADAQEQANTVLSALDLGPQEIISIQINGASAPIPFNLPQRAEFAVAQADVSTPVIGGEQTVQAAVTLQIRY